MAGLQEEDFSFPDLEADEVPAEPIYGCWEANIDPCRLERAPSQHRASAPGKRIALGKLPASFASCKSARASPTSRRGTCASSAPPPNWTTTATPPSSMVMTGAARWACWPSA
ncbi:hypothetical protein ACRAWD_04290 [Caulobacter segnis]